MDPVTLIVTALAAGAVLGLKDVTSAAVKDAYAGLKALVKKRFAGRPKGELALAEHEGSQTWDEPLAAELAAAGADRDDELVTAAQALMRLVDEEGFEAGKYIVKYQVDARGSQGVVVGDHAHQRNVFGTPPGG